MFNLASFPLPTNATQTRRIKIIHEKHIRKGPGTTYAVLGVDPSVCELQPGNLATIWPESVQIVGILAWVYIRQLTGNNANAEGWAALDIAKGDYEALPDTKPIPVVEAPPAPPAIAPQPTPPPVTTVTPDPAKTSKTREIRILIDASDETTAEFTAALLTVAAALTEFCKTWGVFRDVAPVIEVKEGV